MQKILIKYPSRGRPQRFIKGLANIHRFLSDCPDVHISCTLDEDDPTMNNPAIRELLRGYPNTSVEWGFSDSKIHAVNRSMPDIDWDILVVFSDDMRFCEHGFDNIIRGDMETFFPGGDGYLHYYEKDSKDRVSVMTIMDRKYYNRFGWIYHPAYTSLWVDNEQTETAQILGRYAYINQEIFKHYNPAYNYPGFERDTMFNYQQEIGWSADQTLYNHRKAKNFDLHVA